MRLKKHTKLFNRLLLLVFALILPQLASAYDFMVDGLCYNDIGYIGYSYCATVTYDTNDESDLHYTNLSGTLNIPSSVINNGTTYLVISIGYNAFSGCSGLTSVNIPNSVTHIEGDAFWGCSGLTSMEIPNSVISIGGRAFYECSGLTSVSIPNSVTSIGNYAFSKCSGLTSVTIPNSVTSIGDYAFNRCSGLTSMVVESGNTKYDSRNNCNAIIETATNTLISGCKNTIIPNSVTSIGRSAFNGCSGLTSVTIGNSVTSISDAAFYGCNKLRTITSKIENPESVTYGSDIFQGVITTHCKLYVPAGKVEDYQFTAPWSDFLNILEEGGGSTTPVHGDVNGDGVVTAADVTAIYDILLGNRKDEKHNQ